MTAVRRRVRLGLAFALMALGYACSNARITGEAWCPFRVCERQDPRVADLQARLERIHARPR